MPNWTDINPRRSLIYEGQLSFQTDEVHRVLGISKEDCDKLDVDYESFRKHSLVIVTDTTRYVITVYPLESVRKLVSKYAAVGRDIPRTLSSIETHPLMSRDATYDHPAICVVPLFPGARAVSVDQQKRSFSVTYDDPCHLIMLVSRPINALRCIQTPSGSIQSKYDCRYIVRLVDNPAATWHQTIAAVEAAGVDLTHVDVEPGENGSRIAIVRGPLNYAKIYRVMESISWPVIDMATVPTIADEQLGDEMLLTAKEITKDQHDAIAARALKVRQLEATLQARASQTSFDVATRADIA